MAREMLVTARDSLNRAILATTSTDRINPALPFWSHSAVENIGAAAALVQAVDACRALSHAPINPIVYSNAFEGARRLIVDAASAVQAGKPADPAAFAAANAKLRSIVHQLDFDITKHDPVPPAVIEPTPKWR
jgi:hypothetical protein